MKYLLTLIATLGLSGSVHAEDKFRQLEEILPTPDELRLGSGRPGPAYWQQKVDYSIDVTLDEARHRVIGSEDVRYENRSPHTLTYLWVQLDNNAVHRDASQQLIDLAPDFGEFGYDKLARTLEFEKFDGRIKLGKVVDSAGK
ncbi:MAG: aminopeptidase, partial [Myxococcota bacterium]